MAVYGYARVSTGRQADDGESLGQQERRIEGYALMQGMTLDRMFIERGVSGSKPLADRPEGAALLNTVGGGDVIITSKLDRMFRSAIDALNVCDQVKAKGIGLHMIDLGGDVIGDGISKLVFTILSAVAEAERDRIRERIRDVKTDQRQRGRYLGGHFPFGWRKGEDGELVAIAAEQDAIARMIAMRAAGRSLRHIADAMKTDGFVLSHAGVGKIVERQAAP